jgi:hypothetical protein
MCRKYTAYYTRCGHEFKVREFREDAHRCCRTGRRVPCRRYREIPRTVDVHGACGSADCAISRWGDRRASARSVRRCGVCRDYLRITRDGGRTVEDGREVCRGCEGFAPAAE